jgi:hypothetical protein
MKETKTQLKQMNTKILMWDAEEAAIRVADLPRQILTTKCCQLEWESEQKTTCYQFQSATIMGLNLQHRGTRAHNAKCYLAVKFITPTVQRSF